MSNEHKVELAGAAWFLFLFFAALGGIVWDDRRRAAKQLAATRRSAVGCDSETPT